MNAPTPNTYISTLAAMKAAKRWLIWRYGSADAKGKLRKVPYYVSGGERAIGLKLDSPEDVAQFATYDEAVAACEAGRFTGLGFALGPDGTDKVWQGIDLDKLSQHPENADLPDQLPGYVEESPSGDGVHAIGYGFPFKSMKQDPKGCEAYASGRFFTFTGKVLRDPPLVCLGGMVEGGLRPRFSPKRVKNAPAATQDAPQAASGVDVMELASLLRKIPVATIPYQSEDATEGEPGWLTVIQAAHHEFAETADEQMAIDLLNRWSRGPVSSPDPRYEEGCVERVWNSSNRGGGLNIEHIRLMAGELRDGGTVAERFQQEVPAPVVQELPEYDPTPFELPEDAAQGNRPPFPDPFPGPMADMVAEVIAKAFKPQPELSTLGVLEGMAAGLNGRYHLANGTRGNLFGTGICETGGGKEHVIRAAEMIATAAGAKVIAKPASGEGLEDELVGDFCNVFVSVDEAGFTFAPPEKLPPYQLSLKRIMLQLFSRSGGTYRGRPKSGEPGRSILHPCVSILGFTTVEVLARNLTAIDIASGELPRHMLVFGRDNVRQRRILERMAIPASTMKQAKLIKEAFQIDNNDAAAGKARHLIEVKIGSEAQAALDGVMDFYNDAPRLGTFTKALYSRSYEKVEHVAMILAVWRNPLAPAITVEMINWALAFVNYSDWSLNEFVDKHMVGSKIISDSRHIAKIVDKVIAGDLKPRNRNQADTIARGLAPWSLVVARSGLDTKEFFLAVEYLVNVDGVEVVRELFQMGSSGGTKEVKSLRRFEKTEQ